jgi:hypothetical protein
MSNRVLVRFENPDDALIQELAAKGGVIVTNPDAPQHDDRGNAIAKAVHKAAVNGMVNIRILASAQKANPVLNQKAENRVVPVRLDVAIQRIRQGIAELVTE